jgi:iron complex transport system substrate-binding protein
VTIEHVYGETTIEAQPERIATVAWANHEVPLALGVVPVGMSKATWGDDDSDGVLPWVEDQLTELDAETPVLFDETEGIDFEAVADTQPDVILASYSGLTQEEYDTLSKIAPVVAYPDIAWGTSVQDMIRLNSEAMGMAAEGEQLIEDLDARITEAWEAHPELEGASAVFTYIDPNDLSQVGFYTTHDTRPGFLESVGMATPEAVAEASSGTDEFYTTISAEQGDQLDDADVVVTYGDAEGKLVETMRSDPLLSKIDAIESGAVATLVDSTPLAASANPSPLSIPWGIDDYFALLAEAAAKSG